MNKDKLSKIKTQIKNNAPAFALGAATVILGALVLGHKLNTTRSAAYITPNDTTRMKETGDSLVLTNRLSKDRLHVSYCYHE